MTTSTPKVKTPPPWVTDPSIRLIACIDGPLQNQWFFESEWTERVAAAQRMLALGQRRSATLDYVQDGVTPHPEWPLLAQGAAMYHRPTGRRS